jgi:transposase
VKLSAALDTSTTKTAICVVNSRDGSVVFEATVATDPAIIFEVLAPYRPRLDRVGHEAGAVAPWLQPELAKRCCRRSVCRHKHVRAAMSAQRNKTDAADALGLAHIVRTGWFRQTHIKTAGCYRLWLLLTQCRNLKRKVLYLENTIRHSLKAFGIRINGTGRSGFEAAVREAVAEDVLTSELMDAMLAARAMLWKQYRRLHDLVVKFVARHELCWRFMAIPGVGPVTALSFVTAIDVPSAVRATWRPTFGQQQRLGSPPVCAAHGPRERLPSSTANRSKLGMPRQSVSKGREMTRANGPWGRSRCRAKDAQVCFGSSASVS